MNLYKHYKNKLYKFKGVVKHSETLEDLVYYEALYPNASGQFWVRPRQMFFEDVVMNGTSVPRFAAIPHRMVLSTQINAQQTQEALALAREIFTNFDANEFSDRLRKAKNPCLILAYLEDLPIGFKLGYEQDGQVYYSWLGGVKPDYRQLGFGSLMMQAMTDWCRDQGYNILQTKTRNSHPAMMILNLKHGFKIIKTYFSKDDDLRVVMEKSLKVNS